MTKENISPGTSRLRGEYESYFRQSGSIVPEVPLGVFSDIEKSMSIKPKNLKKSEKPAMSRKK